MRYHDMEHISSEFTLYGTGVTLLLWLYLETHYFPAIRYRELTKKTAITAKEVFDNDQL